MEKTHVIITLFSADSVRLDEESLARVLDGDYPIRVKSKILATIRESLFSSREESVVGFLPIKKGDTQYHYSELESYLEPEVSCKVVSDLITKGKEGKYSCKQDLVAGNAVIVISDKCSNWDELTGCLEEAGAQSVKCISIIG